MESVAITKLTSLLELQKHQETYKILLLGHAAKTNLQNNNHIVMNTYVSDSFIV